MPTESQLINIRDAKPVACTAPVFISQTGEMSGFSNKSSMPEKEGPSETKEFEPFCPGEKTAREGHTDFAGGDSDN